MAIRFGHLLAVGLLLGSVALFSARIARTDSSPSSVCFFDMDSVRNAGFQVDPTDHPAQYAFDLVATKIQGPSSLQLDQLYGWNKNQTILQAFQASIQYQIQNHEHCDALMFSGKYSMGAFTPRSGSGQLRIEDIVSSILQNSKDPAVQQQVVNWAKQVKAVYLDGSKTTEASSLMSSAFPNALVLTNEKDISVKAYPVKVTREEKEKIAEMLQAIGQGGSPVEAVSNLQQVQSELSVVQTNPLLADPAAGAPSFYEDLIGKRVDDASFIRSVEEDQAKKGNAGSTSDAAGTTTPPAPPSQN